MSPLNDPYTHFHCIFSFSEGGSPGPTHQGKYPKMANGHQVSLPSHHRLRGPTHGEGGGDPGECRGGGGAEKERGGGDQGEPEALSETGGDGRWRGDGAKGQEVRELVISDVFLCFSNNNNQNTACPLNMMKWLFCNLDLTSF